MEYGISGYQSDYRYMKKNVVQLATNTVRINGDNSDQQVYLLGTQVGDQLIYQDLVLVVEDKATGSHQFYAIPTSKGMGGGIDIADFNHNGYDDIGVYVLSGGTGSQVDYYIFFNQGEELKLGFSNKMLEEAMKYQVSYLPQYEVAVKNMTTADVTKLDVSARSADYLQAIYDEEGYLKAPLLGAVAPVSGTKTIQSYHQPSGSDLILTQRILGRSHNDTLGYIQSMIEFDEGKYYVYNTEIHKK